MRNKPIIINSFAYLLMAVLGLILLTPHKQALSANVIIGTGECTAILEGDITLGDLEKLRPLIKYGDTLCLNSMGGSFSEGINIAQYLDGKGITTYLPAGTVCYSSCAIVFMAGSEFEDVYLDKRKMHVTAKLGFHAPYLILPAKNYDTKDIERSYTQGLQSVSAMMELGALPGRPDSGFIPSRVILELMKRGPDELYIIDTPYKAKELHIEIIDAPVAKWNVLSLCNACINYNNNLVRKDICETADAIKLNGRENRVDFKGVAAEGQYICPTKLRINIHGQVTAFISKNFISEYFEDVPQDEWIPLSNEMALQTLTK